MRKVKYLFIAFLITATVKAQNKQVFGTADYVRAMKHVTDVMVNDVTNPVAASRYYAYINHSASEAASRFKPSAPSASKKMKGYIDPEIPAEIIAKSDGSLAVILSIYNAGVKFLPSGYILKKNIDSLRLIAGKKRIS